MPDIRGPTIAIVSGPPGGIGEATLQTEYGDPLPWCVKALRRRLDPPGILVDPAARRGPCP